MRHIIDLAQPAKRADTVVILLPGAYQQPEDFIAEGFVSKVHQLGLNVDLIMAELSFSHITSQTAVPEIHHSLMQPTVTAGYQNIWLAGISIGAYVAMAYANRYPTALKGLLLIAPYPGNCITTGEIKRAGGIKTWSPETIADDDIERGNWYWLKNNHNAIEVHLGYGEQDRFVEGQSMMADALPAENVNTIVGDHTWPVWLKLWQNFLIKEIVIKSC